MKLHGRRKSLVDDLNMDFSFEIRLRRVFKQELVSAEAGTPPSAEGSVGKLLQRLLFLGSLMSYIPPHRRVTSWVNHEEWHSLQNRHADKLAIRGLLDRLENTVVESTCEYEGTCSTCNGPYWGVFDEQKAALLHVPLGLKWKLVPNFRDYILGYSWQLGHGPQLFFASRSPYEIRMLICRSGVFTREQLRGGRFTEHELEVNDRAFRALRPPKCDCHYGAFADSAMAEFLAEAGIPSGLFPDQEITLSRADADFIAGKPVRTGYRRRSLAAKIRRAGINRCAKAQNATIVATTEPPPERWTRGWRKNRHTPRTLGRKARRPYRRIYPLCAPSYKGHEKYWYFLRTRGSYYVSVHNPVRGQWQLISSVGGQRIDHFAHGQRVLRNQPLLR
jgi:hypothetical protein